MILEYTIGGVVVTHAITPNLVALVRGVNSLPNFFSGQFILRVDIVVDLYAIIMIFIITALLCVGIKESIMVRKYSHIGEHMCFDACHISWWLPRIQVG